MNDAWIQQIEFDARGLVPAVIQDADNEQVLMVGYVNQEAVLKTIESGRVHFWSRSRDALWCKGETSGHAQQLVEMRLDCDGDALLIKVKQKVACCHTGYRSCFFRQWTPGGWKGMEERVFDPDEVYERS